MNESVTQDEFFGTLRFDERTRSFEATMQLALGHSIAVSIDSMGIEPGEALKIARGIYSTIVRREQEYRRASASTLLDLYNGSWGDGATLDTDELARRLSPSSLSIAPPESGATLYYSDGGLFAGHSVEVFLDTQFGFINAELIG